MCTKILIFNINQSSVNRSLLIQHDRILKDIENDSKIKSDEKKLKVREKSKVKKRNSKPKRKELSELWWKRREECI